MLVGQVGNLRRVVNPPTQARLPIARRLTTCPTLILLVSPLLLAQRPAPNQSIAGSGDRQIEINQKQAAAQPANLHFQNLLASAYIQKVRESQDFSYLDRASKIVDAVLDSDAGNYEGMRLRSEIELERHSFAQVAEYSEELIKLA